MVLVKQKLLSNIMEKKNIFSTFLQWLKSTEMFARPSKQLPGKWQLFEYYVDAEDDLQHFTESQLKKAKENWIIEFLEEEIYKQQSQLPIPIISNIENGNWSISKNFITFIHPNNFRNNVEFQFAIEKGILKLLKKDAFGKIEFFGFFKGQD